jgi:hypothetical protein
MHPSGAEINHMKRIHRVVRSSIGEQVIDWLLVARTMTFIGIKHKCPCCGWSLRAFTKGGSSLRSRPNGYCPRCNSKPRHRWLWLYLQQHTDIFTRPQRVLHVSPGYSTGWGFRKFSHLNYVSGEIKIRPFVQLQFDLTISSFATDSFDKILCIHVLEHIAEDHKAISELFRMLKPGGTTIIAFPIRMDQKTFEDPSITSPEDRKRHFGERDHKRFYGYDAVDRLQEAGFMVETLYARDLPQADLIKYGLKAEEVMFICMK